MLPRVIAWARTTKVGEVCSTVRRYSLSLIFSPSPAHKSPQSSTLDKGFIAWPCARFQSCPHRSRSDFNSCQDNHYQEKGYQRKNQQPFRHFEQPIKTRRSTRGSLQQAHYRIDHKRINDDRAQTKGNPASQIRTLRSTPETNQKYTPLAGSLTDTERNPVAYDRQPTDDPYSEQMGQ